jgi:hypothetical protein
MNDPRFAEAQLQPEKSFRQQALSIIQSLVGVSTRLNALRSTLRQPLGSAATANCTSAELRE